MTSKLPSNVHVSAHPCVRGKLSQLRSRSTNAQDTKRLVNDISLMVGCEALANSLTVVEGVGSDKTPLGYDYVKEAVAPERIALIPILRSGLGMVDGKSFSFLSLFFLFSFSSLISVSSIASYRLQSEATL